MNGLVIVTATGGVANGEVQSVRTVDQKNYRQIFLGVCETVSSNWDEHNIDEMNEFIENERFETGQRLVSIIWLDDDNSYDA